MSAPRDLFLPGVVLHVRGDPDSAIFLDKISQIARNFLLRTGILRHRAALSYDEELDAWLPPAFEGEEGLELGRIIRVETMGGVCCPISPSDMAELRAGRRRVNMSLPVAAGGVYVIERNSGGSDIGVKIWPRPSAASGSQLPDGYAVIQNTQGLREKIFTRSVTVGPDGIVYGADNTAPAFLARIAGGEWRVVEVGSSRTADGAAAAEYSLTIRQDGENIPDVLWDEHRQTIEFGALGLLPLHFLHDTARGGDGRSYYHQRYEAAVRAAATRDVYAATGRTAPIGPWSSGSQGRFYAG